MALGSPRQTDGRQVVDHGRYDQAELTSRRHHRCWLLLVRDLELQVESLRLCGSDLGLKVRQTHLALGHIGLSPCYRKQTEKDEDRTDENCTARDTTGAPGRGPYEAKISDLFRSRALKPWLNR
jgi:hypothetical protein